LIAGLLLSVLLCGASFLLPFVFPNVGKDVLHFAFWGITIVACVQPATRSLDRAEKERAMRQHVLKGLRKDLTKLSLTPAQVLHTLKQILMVEVWFDLRRGGQFCLPRTTQPEAPAQLILLRLGWSHVRVAAMLTAAYVEQTGCGLSGYLR
jgi:hypothetical protein